MFTFIVSFILISCQSYRQATGIVLDAHYQIYPVAENSFQQLTRIPAQSLWQGYNSPSPLGLSGDERLIGELHFFLPNEDRSEIWVYESDTPGKVVLLAFHSVVHPYADAQGQYYGYHLCADVSIDETDYRNWETKAIGILSAP